MIPSSMIFVTDMFNFTMKEIEVFEIVDSTVLLIDINKCANECLFRKIMRDAGELLWTDEFRSLRRAIALRRRR
jgi:hypothetical protein